MLSFKLNYYKKYKSINTLVKICNPSCKIIHQVWNLDSLAFQPQFSSISLVIYSIILNIVEFRLFFNLFAVQILKASFYRSN